MAESHSHVVPPRVYVAVFLALMALTALTTWIAYIDLGVLNVVIMLAIAGLKASLVVLFFMHVRWEGTLTKITFTGALFWLLVLIVGSASDVVLRFRPMVAARLGLPPETSTVSAATERLPGSAPAPGEHGPAADATTRHE